MGCNAILTLLQVVQSKEKTVPPTQLHFRINPIELTENQILQNVEQPVKFKESWP